MPKKKKCTNHNHTLPKAQISVRHCPQCGVVVNKDANVVRDCSQYHFEKSQNGYNYCPDCGQKI